jgi:acyl dehydratase
MTHSFAKISDLGSLAGREIAVSDWLQVPQSLIDGFGQLTNDRQWIHVDPKRAAEELPGGQTIVHGFLILSLFSHLYESTISMEDRLSAINYGFNRLRFTDAVPSGSRIRARFALQRYDEITGGAQLTWDVTIEREQAEKPACVAEWIMRAYR